MKSYEERRRDAREELTCCGETMPVDWVFCPYCGEELYVNVPYTEEELYDMRKQRIQMLRGLYRTGRLALYRKERKREYGKAARLRKSFEKFMSRQLIEHCSPTEGLKRLSSNGSGSVTFRRGDQ